MRPGGVRIMLYEEKHSSHQWCKFGDSFRLPGVPWVMKESSVEWLPDVRQNYVSLSFELPLALKTPNGFVGLLLLSR